jgi:hypothetical protein
MGFHSLFDEPVERPGQFQKLLSGFRVSEYTANRGGDRGRGGLFDSAPAHAHMLGLNHDHDSLWLKLLFDAIGYLIG